MMNGEDRPEWLLLFDGGCGVCDRTVRWLLRHDSSETLFYAPLSGPTGQQIIARHPELPPRLDSLILVHFDGLTERVYIWSDAVLGCAALLPAPWFFVRVLRAVPRLLRDGLYRAFAARRYALFGPVQSCACLSVAQQARILE